MPFPTQPQGANLTHVLHPPKGNNGVTDGHVTQTPHMTAIPRNWALGERHTLALPSRWAPCTAGGVGDHASGHEGKACPKMKPTQMKTER